MEAAECGSHPGRFENDAKIRLNFTPKVKSHQAKSLNIFRR